MGRRYRRRRNRASAASLVREAVQVCSQLPWRYSLVLGSLLFILFYFVAPAYLEAKLVESQGSNIYPMLDALYGRRIHWVQRLGIGLGLIGCFFAIRNYLLHSQAGRQEKGIVAFVARLLGRRIDS